MSKKCKQKNYITALNVFNEAKNFLILSKYADEKSKEFSSDGLSISFASARNVNLAFACELFIKSLIMIEKDNIVYGHNLYDLL